CALPICFQFIYAKKYITRTQIQGPAKLTGYPPQPLTAYFLRPLGAKYACVFKNPFHVGESRQSVNFANPNGFLFATINYIVPGRIMQFWAQRSQNAAGAAQV
ncbi:MAG: hypothetical protein J6C49_03965, partial [Elusimicrobiaceae bacterium]|nr:hypothetical protein [Elusimicrobiaceae bacterium]